MRTEAEIRAEIERLSFLSDATSLDRHSALEWVLSTPSPAHPSPPAGEVDFTELAVLESAATAVQDHYRDLARAALLAVADDLVKAEREACARLITDAEQEHPEWNIEKIASAIRARRTQEPGR